jgi:hypothetical protein
VRLKPESIVSLDIAGPGGNAPDGLLGSDVLSRYGRVAIDYDHDVLLLDPRLRRRK